MNYFERDLALLRYLHKFKVATYEQIHRDIYPEYKLNTVRIRVLKMMKDKFIKGFQDKLFRKGQKVVSLTKLGFEKFLQNGEERRMELKSEAIDHDLELIDVHYHLMQSPKFISYFSENQLQTWGSPDEDDVNNLIKLNNDAIAKISFNKGEIYCAIEYEHSQKSKLKYTTILKKIYNCDDLPLILYVCKDKSIMDKISGLEKEIYADPNPKIFYQLLHEIISGDTFKFYNHHNKYLEFIKHKPPLRP